MQAWLRKAGLLALPAILLATAGPLHAQGVTAAAVTGQVTQAQGGAPIEGATITVVNGATGQRYQTNTLANGRFNIENVTPGSPYTIVARAVGYAPQRRDSVSLTLGDRHIANFSMRTAAVQLEEITVNNRANEILDPSRTGASQTITSHVIENLPTLGRSFTDFIQSAPAVSGTSNSPSIGGQNNRFNNIQIDGGVNNDLFGLGSSGAPGGQVGARPISLEAIKEYQVLIAPFDIRQGGFTGGLVNAITKSGTNEFHGSAFLYFQNQGLVGKDTAGAKAASFDQKQYGFTFSGPIIKDKLHFFVDADLQSQTTPWGGQQIGTSAAGGADSVGIGITQATAERIQNIIKNNYGFDPGSWTAPTLGSPDNDAFAKLSYHLGTNSDIEVSDIWVKAHADKLTRNSTFSNFRDGYQLSNSGWVQANKTNTLRGKWTALFGNRYNNELIVGYSAIRDHRDNANLVPTIQVGGDRPGTWVGVGTDRFSYNNLLNQDIFEVTDNLTVNLGANRFTVGTHNEFFKFTNNFFQASQGVWSFGSADSLEAGTPFRYEIALPGPTRPEGPLAKFKVSQYGVYAQDEWTPNGRLTLTLGVRADLPHLPSPPTNPALATEPGLNIDTGNFPNSNVLWSPRFGFNYDLTGKGTTMFRGGVGIFSGRPPYVWVSNAFANTGLEQVTLICNNADVPTFTKDIANQPTTCASGAGASASAATINYFDPSFKFPQDLKVAAGIDHQLPWGMVGTLDFIYTKAVNSIYLQDVNLNEVGTNSEGRPMYGSIAPNNGRSSPNTVTSNFRQVIEHTNKSKDWSTSFTVQLQKRFNGSLEFNAGYTYQRVKDLMSLTSSIASSNLSFTPLQGTMADRTLGTSAFEQPNKITFSGTVGLPFRSKISLIYIGISGTPYTYMINGDANADGITSNDIAYIPRDAADITLADPTKYAALDAYINTQQCLVDARGSIMPRNTCRNPWRNILNARVAKTVGLPSGQSLELTMDVFNLLRLVGSDWGLFRSTTGFETATLLRQTGYDPANNRPIYDLSLPQRDRVQTTSSRWQIQLGAKYRL